MVPWRSLSHHLSLLGWIPRFVLVNASNRLDQCLFCFFTNVEKNMLKKIRRPSGGNFLEKSSDFTVLPGSKFLDGVSTVSINFVTLISNLVPISFRVTHPFTPEPVERYCFAGSARRVRRKLTLFDGFWKVLRDLRCFLLDFIRFLMLGAFISFSRDFRYF